MKSIFIRILLVTLVLQLSYSCRQKNNTDNDYQQLYTVFPEEADSSLFFEDSMVTYIRIPNNPTISQIIDIGIMDSLCFILDNNGAVTSVKHTDGGIVRQFFKKGRSKGEMINPICLTTDSSYIYIFDGGKNEIIIYDRDFHYIDNINLEISPSSILKVSNGFLCYESHIPTVYFVNNEGRINYSREMSNRVTDVTTGQQILSYGPNNEIYIRPEYSDTVFVWNGDEVKPVYVFNYSKKIKVEEFPVIKYWQDGVPFLFNCFFTKQGLLAGCMQNKMLYHIFFDVKSNICYHYVPSKNGILPFTPKWQFGNMILSIEGNEVFDSFLDTNLEINKQCQLVLLKYEL